MPDPTATEPSAPAAGASESVSAHRSGPSAVDAELALARLGTWSSDVRGGCVLDPAGEVIAASGDRDAWAAAARGLLAAADHAAGAPVTQAHVGTEDGEVFAVRERGYALVAATERFALASLTLFDIRSALRQLAAAPRAGPANPGGDR